MTYTQFVTIRKVPEVLWIATGGGGGDGVRKHELKRFGQSKWGNSHGWRLFVLSFKPCTHATQCPLGTMNLRMSFFGLLLKTIPKRLPSKNARPKRTKVMLLFLKWQLVKGLSVYGCNFQKTDQPMAHEPVATVLSKQPKPWQENFMRAINKAHKNISRPNSQTIPPTRRRT